MTQLRFEPLRPVVSIGECMIELARGPDGRFGLAIGGDTFNTAVYLARCGAPVAYATAIGDDPYSTEIRTTAEAEGVDTRFLYTVPGRNAGLYLIETTASGERSFWYWRERAPARELLEIGEAAQQVRAACLDASLVYVSGITLSIYSPRGLDTLADILEAARLSGVTIVMDGNYRPRNFGGDVARARAVFERFWRLADLALPTYDDERSLWVDTTPSRTIERLRALGVREIAVKNGAHGCLLWTSTGMVDVPCPAAVQAIDTTAAGDSFNAGYIFARRLGREPHLAAIDGHRLAAAVITHRGAIVPRTATATAVAAIRDRDGRPEPPPAAPEL